MGLPAPRRVSGKPYFQVVGVGVDDLQLIIYADGTSKHRLIGASPFPRHWIYDDSGTLVDKSGEIDFERWWRSRSARTRRGAGRLAGARLRRGVRARAPAVSDRHGR